MTQAARNLQENIAKHKAERAIDNEKRRARKAAKLNAPPIVEVVSAPPPPPVEVKPKSATAPGKIDPELFKAHWLKTRARGRHDLLFLCREVLQYRDIEPAVHGPIIERLQKFPTLESIQGNPLFKGGTDIMTPDGGVTYTPIERSSWTGACCDVWHLQGRRSRMFLDPRGHLKTTVISISHNIQWILNYYDVRILLSMATGDQVVKVMGEVLNHFRFNENFRWLYPEYCPPAKSAKDFGNNDGFTVPCRARKWMKEPTVSSCSIGRVVAGGHYEVICNSDLVDKENVKTPNQINEVKNHFGYLNPLLERGDVPDESGSTQGWQTLEGTRYDDDDLYGMVEDGEAKLPLEKRSWQISIRSAENPDKEHPLWPRRFPTSELEKLQSDPPRGIGVFQYAGQYLQKPVPVGSGLAVRDQIKWKPRNFMKAILASMHMTVDLAGMDPNSTGDDTVLTTAGFDRDGRMNVVDVRCGHFDPFEVISMMFLLCDLYPKTQDIKIEKEAHARVLLPFIRREQEKRGKFLPPIIPIQRDNRTSKKQRIKGLQPFFMGELISFAEEIGCKAEVILQITRFSVTSTYKDDILDTLADQLQNRDGGVTYDLFPAEKVDANAGQLPWPAVQFQGFDENSKAPLWWGEQSDTNSWYHDKTGM